MGLIPFNHTRRIDADTIGLYTNDLTKLLQIDKATADTTTIKGQGTTGDNLVIYANTIDSGSKLILAQHSELFAEHNYDVIYLGGGTTRWIQIDESGTAIRQLVQVTNYDLDLYPNGTGNVNILGTSVSDNYDLALLGDGTLCLKETSTPTADTNYGKVYCKNDNKLYFQDGAGTEHEIAFI